MVKMSLDMERYFHDLDRQIEGLYKIAREARALGLDPAVEPETNVAADIAGRVEELIGPPGVAEEIRELSKNHDRDTVSMIIAQRIIERNKDQDEQKAADLALRCALAIKTEGVVSAPLEGISSVCIKQDSSGRYLSIYFSGPIRSAGGTTQAFVVLLADQIRKWLGLGKYVATKDEIARYVEEIKLYDRVVNLQYTSTPEELEWIVSHLPVEVTGDKTNPDEVSANRNLPRVETNSVRGGACLVINDGVLSKSSKLNKLIFELKIAEWDWLKHIPKDKGTATSPPPAADDGKDKKFGDELFQGQKKDEQTDKRKVPPKNKFIAEVIAGRPIFAHPSAHGGFRIRYGRSRNMGLAGYGFHPATMYITDNFIAVGTQLRVERPGKSTVAMPVDSIEGPIVKLKGGSVIRVDTTGQKEIEAIKAKMDKVLFGVQFRLDVLGFLGMLAMIFFSSGGFASISIIVASFMKSRERFMGIGQAVIFPLYFMSSALYPVSQMPPVIQAIARFNPMSYIVDGVRGLIITGTFEHTLLVDFGVLVVFVLVMFALATLSFKKIIE